MTFDLYFDFTCPYVYRAALWLHELQEAGLPVEPTWRYLSLSQINNREEGWIAWEVPLADPEGWEGNRRLRGLRAMWAAEAARQQGAFESFRLALLRAIHEEGLSLNGDDALTRAAEAAGLDMERWEQARRDPALLEAIGRDHEAGSARGVFGTPTFLFDGSEPAYLKLADVPPAAEAPRIWERFAALVTTEGLVLEIKRPQ